MNKIIMNGHTYTESKDVEGEYILLVNNQKPTPLEIYKWIDIKISQLNNMTKDQLDDEYYSPKSSAHELKVLLFIRETSDKYNVDCSECIKNFFSSNPKSPFTKRKCKRSNGGGIYYFAKFLVKNSGLEKLF